MIFAMKIGALFSSKMKKGILGRKQSNAVVKSAFSTSDKIIWMHAASLGEYEQGLPVLERLKERFPEHKILITFFSPSGYENVVKKQKMADAVCYLPLDRKKWVKEFVSHFRTEIFFTVKYDYWYNLLGELKKQNAKLYVISAYFYESQIFFKPYGNWFVRQLRKDFSWFFHQTVQSTALAKSIGLKDSSTSGDTRYDRVRQIIARDNHVDFIGEFREEKTTVVFGSSWQAEERIAEMLSQKNKSIKIIIAPHDLKRVQHLKEIFPEAVLYSKLSESHIQNITSQVLVIDCIGLLSKIYSYADLAVVGGGFHAAGLHNILEAAVFGIPVFFGNHYTKNPEADELVAHNGALSFEDEFYAAQFILELLQNPELMKSMGENAGKFIQNQPNATEIVTQKILSDFRTIS